MKIGELARQSGLTAHTIRYYERIGLLPRADRDHARQRDYDASILTWIEFLGRMKATGMPIRDMLRYAELRARGAATEPERRRLLERHREAVRARVATLQDCLLVLDGKIAGYAGSSERTDDHDAIHPEPIHDNEHGANRRAIRRQPRSGPVGARPARAR
ncbi:putative transcriptional regulator, MerR family [Bradyrhizobium sp. ORS 285]|uniref:MerR family transcriptional regulator n=1 Tax=Bradyrhizobium sp. ORS 285 TaxID=115808 RepID=UPI0002407F5F|nr:MerR family transcriptional regulator [Bradyrhizobium sp. ORS 285]CCD90295.1 putative transcriptional regulator, MerR family [Bradyrhizobium sp. ORS 285]SMX61435.1 putative transcriptional regulator, MerR family [Bradyrhizobium sp. ORS 285]